ncbi:MAG TPA: Ig-like domain repeat protein, partial [Gemmatimonadales bacterium]|nr:Ig-like domain repeat protein [Gemmatimonadales bacterium]
GVGIVSFTATAEPGTPPSIRVATQPAAAARRGTPFGRQPVVQLLDPLGASLAREGVPVTVTVASGGGALRGTLTRSTGADGRATFTDLALEGPAGRYTLGFSSPGFGSAVSGPIDLARASTSVRITADDPDPSLSGASVRVAYAVFSEGGRPSGNVTVRADDGTTCQATVAAGACALALSRTGSNPLTASYEGDAEFEPSSATEAHTVNAPAVPTLRLTTQPSVQSTAGVPFGRQPVVQLRDGAGGDVRQAGVIVTAGVASGSGTLLGPATSTTDAGGRATFGGLGIAGASGIHTLRFTADGYLPIASQGIDVQPAATTLTIDSHAPDPSAAGEPVTVSFTLTSPAGPPPGDVTVTAGGVGCSASAAAGSCNLTFGQAGTFTITASYAGGGGFAAASDDAQHTVAAIVPPGPSASASSVTVQPGTVAVGDAATVEVTVRSSAGAPLSGVDVSVALSGAGGQVSPSSDRTNGAGTARFTVRSSVAETKTITAVAGGVTLDQRPTLTVTRATSETRIESDAPDPSDVGQPVEVRVSVRGDGGTPTGQVAVTGTGGLACSITLVNGSGSCSVTPTAAGGITFRADYQGDAAFGASSDTDEHIVREPAARILTLRAQPSGSAAPGEPLERQPEVQLALEGEGELRQAGVTVVAQVSGGATLEGTTSVQTDGDGRARFDDLAIVGGEGSYTITFTAEGFAAVTSERVELRRAQSQTDIRDDEPDPSAPAEAVTVSVRVRGEGGTPTGSVTIASADGAICSAPLDAEGEGSCQLTLTTEGETTLTASYPGDDRFAPSSGTADHRVETPSAAASVSP